MHSRLTQQRNLQFRCRILPINVTSSAAAAAPAFVTNIAAAMSITTIIRLPVMVSPLAIRSHSPLRGRCPHTMLQLSLSAHELKRKSRSTIFSFSSDHLTKEMSEPAFSTFLPAVHTGILMYASVRTSTKPVTRLLLRSICKDCVRNAAQLSHA